MAFVPDTHSLLAYAAVVTPPSPPNSGLTFTVTSGRSSMFSTGENITVGPAAPAVLDKFNSEVCRITAINGGTDTLTVTRQQEGSNARSILAGDQVLNGDTPKVFTDIENVLTGVTAGATLNAPLLQSWDGWSPANDTWTYSSTDGHTFVVTTSLTATNQYQAGMKVKCTNNATTFYGIITAVAANSLTIYGGQNYSLVNSAITSPFYSSLKVPFGFNADPTIWTEVTSSTVDDIVGSTARAVWSNLGAHSLAIPIGVWRVSYDAYAQNVNPANSSVWVEIRTTLSTNSATQSDQDFTAGFIRDAATATTASIAGTVHREKSLNLNSKTTYFLNVFQDNQGNGNSGITIYGSRSTTFIKATSGYL